ncbi:MAG TPA: ComF family protein [Bacteroidales bacterium]|nr:ComF family protein [Bacteroidales bacterium]
MMWFVDLLDDFAGLLFPRTCFGCGNHLMRNEKVICTECLYEIPCTNFHNEPENQVAKLFWGRCRIERAAAYSGFSSGSRMQSLIHNLKYKGITEIGIEMGKMYGSILSQSGFTSGIDIIIPVPLHPSRQRSRGFNQSELIAGGISEGTGLPVFTKILVRSSRTKTQTKKSRFSRWINVEGIFQVNDVGSIKGKHILLVDDVITTGSTLEACANELLKAENVKVSVAALAYAVM